MSDYVYKGVESPVSAGYEYYLRNSQLFVGAQQSSLLNGKYIEEIDSRILQLKWVINAGAMNMDGSISENPSNHGNLAEYWHAFTYRISAAAKGTSSWAHAEDSPEARRILGGADITTSWKQDYGLKYYDSAKKSGMQQAKTLKQEFKEYQSKHPDCTQEEFLRIHGYDENADINLPKYEGQARLIPADQLEDARRALQKRIDHDLHSGSDAQAADVRALIETRDMLTDHIEGPDGEKSFPLTYKQAKQLQECAKTGSFDPKDFDIDAAKVADRTLMMENVISAGLTAMWTSALLKVAPEILSCIKQLLDDGLITREDIANIGKAGAEGAASGFIRGVLIAAVTTAAELGYLGPAIKAAAFKPDFTSGIAVLVTSMMSIASDSILWAKKDISKQEFFYRAGMTVFMASASYICGVAIQGILVEFPAVGYMLGSFLGSLIGGALFTVKEKFFISICVQNGWTCFGLVSQDYSLPDDVLREMGFDLVVYDDVDHDEVSYDEVSYDDVSYDDVTYDEIDARYISRGVIGVRKVGWIVN